MTLLEFVKHHCGELTEHQQYMVDHHLKQGTLVGVGRAIGRSTYWPMVQRGSRAPLDVIDRFGYEQTAAPLSGKCPA
jgi:hypothetical protein